MTRQDKYGWKTKKIPMIDTSEPNSRQRKRKASAVQVQVEIKKKKELGRLNKRNERRQIRLETPKKKSKVYPGTVLEKRLFLP